MSLRPPLILSFPLHSPSRPTGPLPQAFDSRPGLSGGVILQGHTLFGWVTSGIFMETSYAGRSLWTRSCPTPTRGPVLGADPREASRSAGQTRQAGCTLSRTETPESWPCSPTPPTIPHWAPRASPSLPAPPAQRRSVGI